jgi:hypothetical protein
MVMVKVYARVICSDVEYKTLSITTQTTSAEVVRILLNKFRMKHRDPNLFYLTMEVWIRKTGIPTRSVMVLDDKACPAHLQACCPHQETKFTLVMRRGGLVKVYDSCLMSGSLYKSLLLSDRTKVEELIQLLLYCYNSKEKVSKFALYEVCPARNCERKLQNDELPLRIQLEWPTQDLVFFQLRKSCSLSEQPQPSTRRRLPWTKSVDANGNVTFRLSLKDEAAPGLVHSALLEPNFGNYESFYI